jgi:activating signal cointegrator 1
MKALTICNPYASLICLPTSDWRHKRVENRTWATTYRGPLAIHAGKSLAWCRLDSAKSRELTYGLDVEEMAFGAVVAVAELVATLTADTILSGRWRRMKLLDVDEFAWLESHDHAEGPWCWVLDNVRRLPDPIPAVGKQGLWEWDEAGLKGGQLDSRPVEIQASLA